MTKIIALAALVAGVLSGQAQFSFSTDFSSSQNFTGGVGATGWGGAYGGNNPASTFQSGGTLTISDTGGHWEDGSISGHLLYLSLTGDFQMQAELSSLSTSPYATAGIGAFDPSIVTGSPTVTWIGAYDKAFYRNGDLGTRSVNTGSMIDDQDYALNVNESMPVYLKMIRTGDVFTQYYSLTGTSYTEMDSVVMASLPTTLDVGIWDGSFSGNTSTAVFNSFSVVATPEPTTIAAFGLGGAALLALRRRK